MAAYLEDASDAGDAGDAGDADAAADDGGVDDERLKLLAQNGKMSAWPGSWDGASYGQVLQVQGNFHCHALPVDQDVFLAGVCRFERPNFVWSKGIRVTCICDSTKNNIRQSGSDNRANQMNPNNAEYMASRGNAPLTGEQREAFAKKSALRKENEGNFENRANQLAPKDKLNLLAFEHFKEILRRVVPGMSLRKTGSRAKGTATSNSDWDYHVKTKRPMTIEQRDLVLENCRDEGLQVTCRKAFTVKPGSGAFIDFFPPNAEWHDNKVEVQEPGSVQFDKGGKNAVRKLKQKFPEKNGHDLEQLVLTIRREMGLSDRNDPSGEKRFQEAHRRLNNGEC